MCTLFTLKRKTHSYVCISLYIMRHSQVPLTNSPLEMSSKSYLYTLPTPCEKLKSRSVSQHWRLQRVLLSTLKCSVYLQLYPYIATCKKYFHCHFTVWCLVIIQFSPHARVHCGNRTNQFFRFSSLER